MHGFQEVWFKATVMSGEPYTCELMCGGSMRQIKIAILCAGLLMLAAGPRAWAQTPPPPAQDTAAPARDTTAPVQDTTAPAHDTMAPADRTGHFAFGIGFGPMLSTESGSIAGVGFTGEYFLTNELTVGPLLQVGFDNDYNQVGLSAQVKYMFDLAGNPKVRPNLQGGLGFISASDGGDQTDFLMPIGGGIDVEVAKHLFLNSTLLLNVTGLHDDLYVSWFFGFRVEI
jgi:hypothetical protein